MKKSNNKKLDKQVKNASKAIMNNLEKDLFGPKPKQKRIRLPKVGERLKDNYAFDFHEIGTVTFYNKKFKEYHVKWDTSEAASRTSAYSAQTMTYFLQMKIFVYMSNPNKIWKDLNS